MGRKKRPTRIYPVSQSQQHRRNIILKARALPIGLDYTQTFGIRWRYRRRRSAGDFSKETKTNVWRERERDTENERP